ncbi:MAG: hypothetical protein FJ149_08400 [Euryarchaeota archaeon]|nr:hypothetical protein [Euryarchaeota archaeon]
MYYRERYGRVFVEAQAAMQDCRYRVRAADPASGRISGTTPMTPLSWGENIEIALGASPHGTCVSVSSSAKLNDAGKGAENLGRFFEALDRRLPGSRTVMARPDGYQAAQGPGLPGPGHQNYLPVGQQAPPALTGAMGAASANGVIAIVLGLIYIGSPGIGAWVGALMAGAAITLLAGAALMAVRSRRIGAVLCAVGGLLTVPLGMLGIWAAGKAVAADRWSRDHPSPAA